MPECYLEAIEKILKGACFTDDSGPFPLLKRSRRE